MDLSEMQRENVDVFTRSPILSSYGEKKSLAQKPLGYSKLIVSLHSKARVSLSPLHSDISSPARPQWGVAATHF